jgi:type II secretory pathway pseudopilin PulG
MKIGGGLFRFGCNTFLLGPPAPGAPRSENAFTLVELIAVCVTLLLLALVIAPAAVASKSDSERMVCFNNLRLMGRGMQTWAGDHNQQLSWWTSIYEGGTFPVVGTKPGNAWYEYVFISNELVTPKILACPSDIGVNRAEDWAQFAFSTNYRSRAVSYPIHLHASADAPRSLLSADRNFLTMAQGNCTALVNTTVRTDPTFVEWTNGAVHGVFGHVLLMDGSVEFTSTARLKTVLDLVVDNQRLHFLRAR